MTLNIEPEVRPLEVHELATVSAAGVAAQRPFFETTLGAKGDFSTYVTWGMLETADSPVKIQHWIMSVRSG